MASIAPPSSRAACRPAGLLLALGLVGAALASLPALASSPQAWQAYGQQLLQACKAASSLRHPRPAGERVDLAGTGGGLLSALLLEGTYPQPAMAGRRGLELCLYDSSSRRARVAEADRLYKSNGQP